VRALILAAVLLVFVPSTAAAALRVVVVPGLTLSDLEPLSARGAVGLLVPGAGPTVSGRTARAALVRGKVRSSLRGGIPSGPPLISVETASAPPRGPAIVLALPRSRQANDRRYPIAVLAPGYHGLLTSDSTRIAGLVSIADVAPTALGRDDALGSERAREPVERLEALDRRISQKESIRVAAALLPGALAAALALVFPRAAVLAFATLLAANLGLGAAGVATHWVILLVSGASVAVAAPLLAGLLRPPLAAGLALVSVVAGYFAAILIDGDWVALSPLGPEQTSRFYGLSNLPESLLLVPALAGAALLARRFGAAALAVVAALAFVTVAGSRFGADGGGALVLAVGYAVLAAGLARAPRRALVVAVPAALAVAVALVAVDAATGASSHVTRALGGGPGQVGSDIGERLVLSWDRATSSWGIGVAVAAAILGLVVVTARGLRREHPRRRTGVLAAFAAAVGVSLLVNDSPLDVAVTGLVALFAVYRDETISL
jgi:hypothetical protein